MNSKREHNALRKIIRTDGTEAAVPRGSSIAEIQKFIGADCLDSFTLMDRVHVVFVDDQGHEKGLPVNPKATALYLGLCKPGTTHQIRGDVVILPDADFA